jgi:plastocyanin
MTTSARPIASRLEALVAATLLILGLVAMVRRGPRPRAPRAKVTIEDFALSPKTLAVKAGTKITVKNDDGTYAYHCNIHNSMKGTYRGELKGDLMGEAKAN